MNDKKAGADFANVPLTPSVARRIIEELCPQKSIWKRADLAAEVERLHLARGGTKGTQEPQTIIKKALSDLREDKKIESPAPGQWRWLGSENKPLSFPATDGDILPSQTTSIGKDLDEEISIQKEIGEGPESVYVYYNPNDRELAELKGRDTWECKIGRTATADAPERILSQGAKTALSRIPVVGLVIRTQDSAAWERALHASLRILENELEDSPGTEWFMTSPTHIEAWYYGFHAAISQLRDGHFQAASPALAADQAKP